MMMIGLASATVRTKRRRLLQAPTATTIPVRTFFSEFLAAARQIIRGDDHVNPKKKLERRYLYKALLASAFRENRLKATPEMDAEDIFQETVRELEKKNYDGMANVDLRAEMQELINPQILHVFQAMRRVDERLGIPFDSGELMKNEETHRSCREILLEEHERTQQQQVDERPDSAESKFFATKLSAIDTLLASNNWKPLNDERSSDLIQNGLDPFGMAPQQEQSTDKIQLIRNHQTLNMCRSALIRQELGFSVLCLRSTIAGRGLYLDGSVLAGALVAFQPGDIWPKEHLLTNSPDVMAHFEGDDDDCHISLRFDDFIVDSRASPVTVLSQEGSLNPFALAHMVNHTAPDRMPNCQSTMFNYTAANFKNDNNPLTCYIPNTYARTPTWQSRFFDREETIIQGLGLLARRDSSNEELTYDYRLQSEEPPEWYTIVKYKDGSDHHEDQVVFFRDDWQ